MRKLVLAGVGALGLGLIAQQAQAQIVAQVGGVNITRQQVEAANPAAATNEKLRMETIITLVNRQALLNQARRSGLTNSTEYKDALEQAGTNIAINLMVQHYFKDHPVSEKTVRAAYDKLIRQPAPREVRLREILVHSYADADAVISDLKAGQSFSTLAAEKSLDKASGQLGGEVGWHPESELRAQILKTIQKMKIGSVAGPISVPDGYAVIQLLGTRVPPKPSYDELKDSIARQIRQEEWVQYIIKTRTEQHAHLVEEKK